MSAMTRAALMATADGYFCFALNARLSHFNQKAIFTMCFLVMNTL